MAGSRSAAGRQGARREQTDLPRFPTVLVEKAGLRRNDAILSRALVGHEGGLRAACGAFQPEPWFPRKPAILFEEFPVKKIALSVVLASTVALAACGGAATNNTAPTDANAMTNAVNTIEQAGTDLQNQGAAVSNELNAAAAQAHDAANAM